MADLNSILDFSVVLDKSGIAPVLRITDVSAYPSGLTGITGVFSVLQPDGITIAGSFTVPDISYAIGAQNTANKELRLASDKDFQRGLYVFTYTVKAPGYDDTVVEKKINFRYTKPIIDISPSFDVFTPSLKVNDVTNYAQGNLLTPSIARIWTANVQNLGVVNSQDNVFDLLLNNKYYDAVYSVTLQSVFTYLFSGATWMAIKDISSKTETYATEVPPSLEDLLTQITAYKERLDNCSVSNQDKFNYVYAFTLYEHLKLRGKFGSKIPLREMIDEIQTVLNNGVEPIYEVTNEIIQPYTFKDFTGSDIPDNNIIEIVIGSGNNYNLSSDKRTLTPIGRNGKPSLVGKTTPQLFKEGLLVPFTARQTSVYGYFNPTKGSITLTNGIFSDTELVSISTNVSVETNTGASSGPFDTVLRFVSSAESISGDIRANANEISSQTWFAVNKIVPAAGLPITMRIFFSGVQVLKVVLPSDYLGQPFSYKDSLGFEHTSDLIKVGTVSY